MSAVHEVDTQAEQINVRLNALYELLDKPVARNALDLSKNAETAAKYDVLKRLRQSLRQYLGREGDLFYVGFLGHFSAGKSTTINSLIRGNEGNHERATGLHPTDTTITLLTQSKNSNSLFGVIKEGHVSIRHHAVEHPLLSDIVIADTPGTGDPQFIEEVARDFLPICDVILFFFSAASPVDKSDIPLLAEIHKRLQFIPIHFVITRADELRQDSNSPISDSNLDAKHTSEFINDLISRLNSLLKPNTYTPADFILIDNKADFHISELVDFIRMRCNASSTQARVSMHINKLNFYRNSARELRDFFSLFLDGKLTELNRIVATAEKNITRYHEIVQISNNNLTKAWFEHSKSIEDARITSAQVAKQINVLSDDFSTIPSIAKKRGELSKDLTGDARYAAGGAASTLRARAVAALQDHFYLVQRRIAEAPVDNITAASYAVSNLQFDPDFGELELVPTNLIARRYSELREGEVESLRDITSELRRTLRDIDELLQHNAPLSSDESVINSARESLTKDLNQFFQNVELYRNGVFSLNTKGSISTLGIGQQLDALELGFTDDDKSDLVSVATGELFPGFVAELARGTTRLTALSTKMRNMLESLRAIRTESPEPVLDIVKSNAINARATLQAQLASELQSDIDKLCGNIGTTLASVVVGSKYEHDAAIRNLDNLRRRRMYIVALVTAVAVLIGEFAYHQFGMPAPKSLLGTAVLGVLTGLIVEAIALAVAKWRESAPRLVRETKEKFHTSLNDKVREAIENGIRAHRFDTLDQSIIASRSVAAYQHLVSASTDPWQNRAAETSRMIRRVQADYANFRTDYLAFVDEVSHNCSAYFTDATKNLEILNSVAKGIKERAIEPSFALLRETRDQLELVKQDIAAVEFS